MEHDDKMAHDAEFARWYTTHHDRIRALCSRILRDPTAAEDIAQETLLRAWERREQMREEDLGAWLSVVARNLCLSSLRKDGRVFVTDEIPDRPDFGADPAIEVGRRESRRNVRRALGRLGPRSRKVIDLREVREADYDEIGSELGLSAEGARAIAFRARKAMREHLTAVGEGFSGILVGIRVRISNLSHRVRQSASAAEAGSTPALQAALNFALATGIAISTIAGGSVGSGRAVPEASTVVAAPISTTEQAGGSQAAPPASVAASDHQAAAAPKKLNIPTVAPNMPAPAAHDPESGDARFGADLPIVGPQYVYYDHIDGTDCYTCGSKAFVFTTICRYDPRFCDID